MTRKALMLFALTALLSSCVPGLTMAEFWVKSVFAPTQTDLNRACDRGYSDGKAGKKFSDSLGTLDFTIKSGTLVFFSAVGSAHLFCKIFGNGAAALGLGDTRPKEIISVPTYFEIENSKISLAETKLYLEFLNDKRVVIGSIQDLPKNLEKESQTFSSREWTQPELMLMQNASSFVVVFTQGSDVQRFEIKREDFKGLL